MFEWLKQKKQGPQNLALSDSRGWGIFSAKTGSGVAVSVEQAMRITAVYACVRIIAEGIASTPIHIYKNRSDGGKDREGRHPLSVVFGGIPNDENTTQELLEYVLSSLLLHGNSYCEVTRRSGKVVALDPLDATCMTPRRLSTGDLVFDYRTSGGLRTYTKKDLWRVTGLSKDGVNGYSPITQAREALGVAVAAELHASKTFSNGASIPGVFEIDRALSDEGFDRLKAQLTGGTKLGDMMKPMLLEEGLKYHSISMTLADAQFIESRKFQIAEIARMFAVPLHKLAELSNATFSNIEHQSLEMVRDTYRPWCSRIEQTIRRDLLTMGERQDYFAEFNLEGLLRGDTTTRYAAHASAITMGWKTRNEVRQLERMNVSPGLDEFLVPLNMGNESEKAADDTPQPTEASAALAALEARQVKAITCELGRPDFNEWVKDYYSRLPAKIDADKDTAEAYCAKQLAAILAADDVAELIKDWK